MKQFTSLFKNVGLFAIASFSTKILSFIALPLYTSILTTEQYANIDIMILLTQLITPLFSISIYDAVLRFCFDTDYEKDGVFSVGISIVIVSTILSALLLPAFRLIKEVNGFEVYFVLLYFSGVFATVVSYYLRAINRMKEIVINSILATALNLLFSVILIRFFSWGERGYYTAMIASNLISTAYMIVAGKLWRAWKPRLPQLSLYKAMIKFSAPLTPNAICWWINSSINRLIMNAHVSKSELGLYSASNKIPSMLTLITNTFQQAWTLSTIDAYENSENEREQTSAFFSQVFRMYDALLVAGAFFVIVLSKPIARIMLQGEFYAGWIFIGPLLIGFYFNALNAFAGSILTAIKKTSHIFFTTLIAAAVNIVAGVLLIPAWGGMGAAASVAIGYAAMWFLRIRELNKHVVFSFHWALFAANVASLLAAVIVCIYVTSIYRYVLFFGIFVIIALLNGKRVLDLILELKRKKQ